MLLSIKNAFIMGKERLKDYYEFKKADLKDSGKDLESFRLFLSRCDFSFLKPIILFSTLAILVAVACLLPTHSRVVSTNESAIVAADLSASVRNTLSNMEGFNDVAVVALVLPSDISSYNNRELTEYLSSQNLYSFYLTGKELRALAEGAAVLNSKNEGVGLYMDGINYSYHRNRLPFNKVTALSFSGAARAVFSYSTPGDDAVYHVIGTDSIFSVLSYISYKSLGITKVTPRDASGKALFDYQILIDKDLTLAGNRTADASFVPTVTMYTGFNLIQIVKNPNPVFMVVAGLLVLAALLSFYMIKNIRRVTIWVRIFMIRRRKGHKRFI